MIKHFTADIKKAKVTLKLSYRNNHFYKMEVIKGRLEPATLLIIGKAIPPNLNMFPTFNKYHEGKIDYLLLQEDSKSTYQKFVDTWFAFYNDFMEIQPRFHGQDGKHIKEIIKYLKGQAKTEEGALELWQIILGTWRELDQFHKENTDLKYINSRLNVIINNVKRINQESSQSNDFRSSAD
jgi:hypothetical protein